MYFSKYCGIVLMSDLFIFLWRLSLRLSRIAYRQHFPLVTIRFIPVNDAAPEPGVNLKVDRPMNVAAVGYSSRLDSLENGVEVVLAHSKTVVKHRNGLFPFIEVDSQSVVHVYGREGAYARLRP